MSFSATHMMYCCLHCFMHIFDLQKMAIKNLLAVVVMHWLRFQNDLCCVGWGIKLYSRTHSAIHWLFKTQK